MLSFFAQKNPPSTDLEDESESVKIFLQNSYYFQQMKMTTQCSKLIADIEKITSYLSLKFLLSDFDTEISDNIFLHAIGHNAASVVAGSFGFFSKNANFFYLGMQFYTEVKAQLINYQRFTRTNEYVKQQSAEAELVNKILPADIALLVSEYLEDDSAPHTSLAMMM